MARIDRKALAREALAREALAREALANHARRGFVARGGGARSIAARAALARALWDARGERKLPSERALDAALSALPARELDWLCELSPLAPLYLLPTTRFVRELVATLRALEITRVLEVAAGDGFLSRCLRAAAPDLTVHACDSGAWVPAEARMTVEEQRALRGQDVPGLALGGDVERMSAARATAKYEPELVLCSWLPPGHRLLDSLIRSDVRYVLEIGAGSGVTASAWCWRFEHDFLEGALAASARCRLDARPARALHSRITLYFGKAHPAHHQERVRAGDFLAQFRR